MRKRFIRKQAIKVRKTCKSYARIQSFLERKYHIKVSLKTLKRWWKRYQLGWDLKDRSRRPKNVKPGIPIDIESEIIRLRKGTGYSAYQLCVKFEQKNICISESSIKRMIKKYGLSKGSKTEGSKQSYVRWQREHPNTLWQLDGTQLEDMSWRLPIIDDCSRYCLGIFFYKTMTTKNVIKALERCISMHGKPRQILTDNGSEFGGNGEGDNEFDKWCQKQGIHHIRSGLHKPTTVGKTEKFHDTVNKELPYCYNDAEYFRYRYNHERPHRSLFGKSPSEVYFAFHKLF